MTILVRLIPLVAIVLLTFLLNKDIDKLEDKKTEITKKWPGKVLWFLFGWTFRLKVLGTIIRYLATSLLFWWILNKTIEFMLR